jgi:hypothetical protein
LRALGHGVGLPVAANFHKGVFRAETIGYVCKHDEKHNICDPTPTLIFASARACLLYPTKPTPKNIDMTPCHWHQSGFVYPEKADPL